MPRLPDLEGMAIFAKVAETRGITAAARELGLSAPTVSKALARLEQRLGSRLLNRTSRQFALTDAGLALKERASRLLADAEAAQDALLAQSVSPRGLVRVAVPMSFGVTVVAPLLPSFLQQYPDVSVDLHLSDAVVDLIGDGLDLALRIGSLPDSSLMARRLAPVAGVTVASPAYLDKRGRPTHPSELAAHDCFGYAYLRTRDTWHFVNNAEQEVTVRPTGRLRVNNGEAVLPAAIAGLGIAALPEFIARSAIADGKLERILTGWSATRIGLYLVTPSSGPRPARVQALMDFFTDALSQGG